jgi:hypothetical protein
MTIPRHRVSPTFRAADGLKAFPRRRPSTEARELVANIASQALDVNQDGLLVIGLQSHSVHARVGPPAAEAASCDWRTWVDRFPSEVVRRKANDGHIHHGGEKG